MSMLCKYDFFKNAAKIEEEFQITMISRTVFKIFLQMLIFSAFCALIYIL